MQGLSEKGKVSAVRAEDDVITKYQGYKYGEKGVCGMLGVESEPNGFLGLAQRATTWASSSWAKGGGDQGDGVKCKCKGRG